jgi:putative toxin-antitoxin system antitoxin component (TIGR02293 family)
MSSTKWAAYPAPRRKTQPAGSPGAKAGSVKIETRKIAGKSRGADVIVTTVLYVPSKGIDDFVTNVHAANPLQLIETERKGVAGAFVKDLSRRMEIPAKRMFDILGVPKATAEKKVAEGELLTGNGGRAALGIARLLGMANEIVANSTAAEAKDFDAAKWLGQWLEKPQPALGGRRPAELIDTPTGLDVVARLLGAIESGAYQ